MIKYFYAGETEVIDGQQKTFCGIWTECDANEGHYAVIKKIMGLNSEKFDRKVCLTAFNVLPTE